MSPLSSQARAPRIAVVGQGEVADPRFWSGISAGICSGLKAAGAEPVPINATPPGSSQLLRALRRPWTWETTNPVFATASGLWADRAIRSTGGIDGVIRIGSGYTLRSSAPVVTIDDMTVAQGMLQPWSAVSGLPPRQALRWRSRQQRIYDRCRACCVGSNWTAGSIREDYGIDPGKIRLVGFGRNFAPTPAADRDWSVPRFIFAGVEWERKRGPAVVKAFAEIRRAHPEATLDVVSEHPSLDAPGVTGHGRLSLASEKDRARLSELFSRATCLVLPSTFEAFGIAHVDAGAAGVPSIGTTVGGAPDAVGAGGLLVPPDDPDALLTAMLELCDPETAQRLGDLAVANSALFTWQAVAERTLRAMRPAGVDLAPLAEFLALNSTA